MKQLYFICSSFPPQYAAGNGVAGFFLAKKLVERGCKVRVITPAYGYLDNKAFQKQVNAKKQARLDNGIEVYKGSYKGVRLFLLSGGYLGIPQRFDIQNPQFRVGRALDLLNSLSFFDFSGSIVHIRDPHFSPSAQYLKYIGVPIIYEAHIQYGQWMRFDEELVKGIGLGIDQKIYKDGPGLSFERMGLELSDRIAAVSPWLGKDLCKSYGNYDAKMRMITNGIDLGLFNPQRVRTSEKTFLEKKGIKNAEGKKIILHASSLDYRKGTDIVFDATKKLLTKRDDLIFIFSGVLNSNEYADKLASLEREHSDTVKYVGHTDYREMPALFKFSDVLMHPSRYEPFGLAPIEAASMGCTPVVSDLPIFEDIFGKDYKFKCKLDAEDLCKKTILALESAEENRTGLPELRKKLSERYSWDRQAEQFIEMYKELER